MFGMCQIVPDYEQTPSGYFLGMFSSNVPEALAILGLVLKTRAKLRIVNKSMLMYNEHGVFISQNC